MSNYTDRILDCRDCGTTFTWTAGQQEYFASKQLSQPRRCPACRQAKRDAKTDWRSSAHDDRALRPWR